jgi:hypothetical protein
MPLLMGCASGAAFTSIRATTVSSETNGFIEARRLAA